MAGTATIQGDGNIEDTPNAGRVSVGGGTNYYEAIVGTGSSFFITFSQPIAAFGFYGTDIGDFGGQLWLDFMNGGATVASLAVPHTVNGPSGAGLFFGYINTANLYDRVDFRLTGSSVDQFGFDLMTVGAIEQVHGVAPEPATMLLLASGLLGLGIGARRRRSATEEEDAV